jgi:CHAT domain-containing protein/tetratricopeptide (TPR) repeat protein
LVFGLSAVIPTSATSREPRIAQQATSDEAAIQKLAERLAAAETEEARQVLLEAEKALVKPGLPQALTAQGAQLRSQGKQSQALAIYQLARSIAERVEDKHGLAYALRFLGNHVFQTNQQQALAYYQQSLKLYEELDHKPGIAQMLYNVGEAHRTGRNFASALESYQKSYALREAMADKADSARSLEMIALTNFLLRNYSLALEHYRKGLTLFETLGDQAGMARALQGIGDCYRSPGQINHNLALEHYQKSLAIREGIGDKPGAANVILAMGFTYGTQGNHSKALEHFQRGLTLREALGDKLAIATTQNYVGDAHRAMNNYSAAAAAYQKGLALAETLGNKALMADLFYKMGYIYQAQHNYGVALVYHQKCLALQEAANNKAGIAGALDAICGDQGMQGNTKAALENCQKSLVLKESLGNKQGMASTHNLIAWFHHHNGDYKAALEHFQKVLPQAEATGNWSVRAKALYDAGEAHERLGDLARAVEHYQKAQAQYAAIGVHEESARALWGIGAIQLRQGQTTEALQTARRAIDMARQANGYEALWRAHTLAGQALGQLNQVPAAQSSYEEAVVIIERMRNQLAGSEHERIRYLNERLKPWHGLTEILLAQGNVSAAFDVTESAKARGLLDVMQNGHAVMTESMTPAEQEQEQKIIGALGALNSQILSESRRAAPDQALLTQLRERQQQTRAERETFYYSLYSTHRELRELRGKAQPLKFAEVAQLLPDATTALLNFLVTDDKTFLFVLSKDGRSGKFTAKTHVINLPATALAEQAGKFRQSLAQRSLDFQSSARSLYDLLLKPAAAQLAGKQLLIISPDAGLWELPFQALQPAPNRYLIENHAIAYAPSLSAVRETQKLRRERAHNRPTSQLILAMGNPALQGATITRAKSVLMDETFDALPEAEEQVMAIKRIYGAARSKALTGAEAREEVFKAEAPQYRILHLATHGILNNAGGIYSQLLMAQAADGQEDGLLEAWELIRMKLNADLVVLSACETARGTWGAGEGVIGMSSMLFVAGCPTVAVSQWKVESASTSKLMVEFHRRLKAQIDTPSSRLGTAQALRGAAIKMLRGGQYQHPFWWAGFVVMGDGY